MTFNVALSGLNAAQRDLDVTSNNIANVNTAGFKESRAEFVTSLLRHYSHLAELKLVMVY